MSDTAAKDFFSKYGLALAILFAICIFHSKLGIGLLDITNIEWLRTSNSDWVPDFAAWMYYRNSDWSIPIGIFHGYSYPEVVSVGLTGAIPLLAIPFKLLDPILPDLMQYFGIWLLLCFILQAYFGYKILEVVKIKDPIVKMLGASVFVLSYSFLDRIGHMNLCGHWIVLAGIYWYFKAESTRQGLIAQSTICAISVCIHPYLILFTLAIGSAFVLKQVFNRSIAFWKLPIYILIPILATVGMWLLLGNHLLDSSEGTSSGYGLYSTNLNTFFTPKIDTPLISAMDRLHEEQYEGVAYLGLGFLILFLLFPIMLIRRKFQWKWNKEVNAILIVSFILFAFSISHRVSFNSHLLFEVPLTEKLLELCNIFRASGRYVWLIQYLIMLGLISIIYMLDVAKYWKYLALAFVVGINVIDFHDVIKRDQYIKTYHPKIADFKEEIWTDVICDADKFRMFPSYLREYNSPFDDMEFAFISSTCYQEINSGHLARYSTTKRKTWQNALLESMKNAGNPGRDYLEDYTYVTGKSYLEDFQRIYENHKHEVFEINGYFAFIPNKRIELIRSLKDQAESISIPKRAESFSAFKEKYSNHYFLVSVRDEASTFIQNCTAMNNFLDSIGSEISDLNFRESYVGLFTNKTLISEFRGEKSGKENSPVSLKYNLELEYEGQKIKKDIEISSAGMENGNITRIFVDKKEYSVNGRGLNIVVLDQSGQVVETTNFDTYESCHHFTDKSERSYKVWKIN